MNKKFILGIAAIALVSCGTKYEGKTVELLDAIDSVNYALGLANAQGIKMQYYQGVDSADYAAATNAFVNALVKGYEKDAAEEEEEVSQAATIAKNVAMSFKDSEKSGLAGNPAWTLNEKICFQGMVNAFNGFDTVMTAEVAQQYFQAQYQTSGADEKKAGKAITAKCPTKVKEIALKTKNDSLNYAFGMINGSQIKMFVLANDSTGDMQKEFIKEMNKTLKNSEKFPRLVEIGTQIGKQIKQQEETGLVGVEGLETRFELIKQGFVNGLVGFGDWDATAANQYIQATLNQIQYGPIMKEGEEFLAAKEAEEGVQKTESGLLYKVIKEGKGKKPTKEDKVKVTYEGKLINGTIFDSTDNRDGEPAVFGVGQVIPGWTEALQLMPVGSIYELYIPYNLAYGERGAGRDIPPYSTLIFKVELLSIEK